MMKGTDRDKLVFCLLLNVKNTLKAFLKELNHQ